MKEYYETPTMLKILDRFEAHGKPPSKEIAAIAYKENIIYSTNGSTDLAKTYSEEVEIEPLELDWIDLSKIII